MKAKHPEWAVFLLALAIGNAVPAHSQTVDGPEISLNNPMYIDEEEESAGEQNLANNISRYDGSNDQYFGNDFDHHCEQQEHQTYAAAPNYQITPNTV